MAERRMFAKTIIDSDAFLDMPLTTQALYFHIAMQADDDGFVNSPKKIQRMVGAGDDDLKLLLAKRFLLSFDSGVVVVKHWKIHNYIRNDRYRETVYKEEKAMLFEKDNKAYTLGIPSGIPNGYQRDTQDRIGKDSIGKVREGEVRGGEDRAPAPYAVSSFYGINQNVTLTDAEYARLKAAHPESYKEKIDRLSAYMFKTGKHYESHYATIKQWAEEDKKKQADGKGNNNPFRRISGNG